MYLTICFMASIRRMKGAPYKKVLLVCGHGYGTTTMLKESLLSEYQIHIVDTLPIYKLSSYPDWAAIDYVLSTIRINNSLPKPCLTVNPILQSEDRAAMDRLGIPGNPFYPAITPLRRNWDSWTRTPGPGLWTW
ncbi:MAG: hypothetical protein ACLTBV_07600 [Enterocloster bolteae]